VSSQEVVPNWTQTLSIELGKNDIWGKDLQGNLIKTDRNTIQKYDSLGRLLYSQSIRSIGKLAEISPINVMKVLVFSEEQQTLCVLDNTLTLSEECVDLGKYGIETAIHVCASSQSDRVWVIDQLNSRLLSLNWRSDVLIEVGNLKGILAIDRIDEMIEVGNELFIFDSSKGIYRFDFYGSLLNFYPQEGFLAFDIRSNFILLLKNDELHWLDMTTEQMEHLQLPVSNLIDFGVSGKTFIFRTVDKLFRYNLSLTE
jgi:hypothetical protein